MIDLGTGLDPSRAHLFGRLGILEASVRATVEARRTGDPQPDDPFRGLYVSDEHVDKLLEGPSAGAVQVPGSAEARLQIETEADLAEEAGHHLRLRHLARSFGLLPPDLDILLVAMAPTSTAGSRSSTATSTTTSRGGGPPWAWPSSWPGSPAWTAPSGPGSCRAAR